MQRRCASQHGLLGLGGGLPAASAIPTEAIARASARAIAEPSMIALQYGWPEGDGALRDWIARRLTARGRPTNAREIVVTSGAQQALTITATLLRHEASVISCPDACYPGALDAFRAAGLDLVPSDAREGSIAHYRMTGTENPSGATFDAQEAVSALADGAHVVLDEAYAELVFDGDVSIAPTLASAERAWWIGTFSKTLAPGLRVGWLVPPSAFLARAVAVKRDLDLQTTSMSQRTLVHLLREFDYESHLARLRALYERRAHTLVRALAALFPGWTLPTPRGGFSTWIETDVPGSGVDLLGAAILEGVGFDPGVSFLRDPPSGRGIALRLCWSSVDEGQIAGAARRLRRAWRRFTGS